MLSIIGSEIKLNMFYVMIFAITAGRWFSPDTPVSYTNKSDRHDIDEILLKVAL